MNKKVKKNKKPNKTTTNIKKEEKKEYYINNRGKIIILSASQPRILSFCSLVETEAVGDNKQAAARLSRSGHWWWTDTGHWCGGDRPEVGGGWRMGWGRGGGGGGECARDSRGKVLDIIRAGH